MLKPIRALITRPLPAGALLADFLNAHGVESVLMPTIAYVNCEDLHTRAEKSLQNADWVIWISPQAVRVASDMFLKLKSLSPHLKCAAVGEGTAAALRQAAINVDLVPQHEWGSVGLLREPTFKKMNGQQVVLIKGTGGHTHLAETLMARGAKVCEMNVYERVLPEYDVAPFQAMLKANMLDVLICTSYEGVRNLTQLLGQSMHDLLRPLPLIVVSERIKQLATNLGFQTIWVAKNASHPAILATIQQQLRK